MNTYEKLLCDVSNNKISIDEDYSFEGNLSGVYVDGNIALSKKLDTCAEKTCILAEELGHYHTTVGNILDQSNTANRKQEYHARLWAYQKMVTIEKLIAAKNAGCKNRYEIAERLGVTEEFFQEAINAYKEIYGSGYHQHGDYLICFEPLNIYDITD